MENLEKNNLNNEQKMQILRGLHEIIWDANRLLGKLADSDKADFDLNQFKHDLRATCNFIHNDTHKLQNIKL